MTLAFFIRNMLPSRHFLSLLDLLFVLVKYIYIVPVDKNSDFSFLIEIH